jgi:hypothetical protein
MSTTTTTISSSSSSTSTTSTGTSITSKHPTHLHDSMISLLELSDTSEQQSYIYIDSHTNNTIIQHLKCTICYSPYEYPMIHTLCHNIFCHKCIQQWRQQSGDTCVLCRQSIDEDSVIQAPTCIENMLNELTIQCNRCYVVMKRLSYGTHQCSSSTTATAVDQDIQSPCNNDNGQPCDNESIDIDKDTSMIAPLSTTTTSSSKSTTSSNTTVCQHCNSTIEISHLSCHLENECLAIQHTCQSDDNHDSSSTQQCEFQGTINELQKHLLDCTHHHTSLRIHAVQQQLDTSIAESHKYRSLYCSSQKDIIQLRSKLSNQQLECMIGNCVFSIYGTSKGNNPTSQQSDNLVRCAWSIVEHLQEFSNHVMELPVPLQSIHIKKFLQPMIRNLSTNLYQIEKRYGSRKSTRRISSSIAFNVTPFNTNTHTPIHTHHHSSRTPNRYRSTTVTSTASIQSDVTDSRNSNNHRNDMITTDDNLSSSRSPRQRGLISKLVSSIFQKREMITAVG